MIAALFLATQLTAAAGVVDSAAAVRSFERAHPNATLRRAADGHLALAANLEAGAFGSDPVASARGFLAAWGDAFGIAPGEALETRMAPRAGDPGVVVFARAFRGLPVLGAHVSVGVGAGGAVHAVTSGGALGAPDADFAVGGPEAARLALGGLDGTVKSTSAAWELAHGALHPVWLVGIVAGSPRYESRVFAVDGATGLVRTGFSHLQHRSGEVYRVSPAKPYGGSCPTSTDAQGNVKHQNCATPESVPLLGLACNTTTLTGDAAPHVGRTTVYNCAGGATYSAGACSQTMTSPSATGDFIPAKTDDYGSSKTDPMSELMAYYQVDRHSRFMDSLDPAFVGLPLIPGFTNAYGPSQLGGGGNGPLDNAFYDPQAKQMVFGQGSSVDFAYDAEVVYHEMTHAACDAIGNQLGVTTALFPYPDTSGLNDDPLAINEGNADSFSFSEPGVGEAQLAEFDAEDTISVLFQSIVVGPKGYIRDEGSTFFKTCQGDGTSNDPGRDGEAHDDGEIWAELAYEIFDGLKALPGAMPAGATWASPATPAMFHALEQLVAAPSDQQTFHAYASLIESHVRSIYGQAAGDYVACVAQRRGMAACDGRAVTVYSGEGPFNDQYVKNAWKAFYYSKAEVYGSAQPPAGFTGVPAAHQWKLTVPAAATELKVTVCDIMPALFGAGGSGTLYVRYGAPVSYGLTGSGATADWIYPPTASWAVSYKDCGGGLGGGAPTVATISSAGCTGCGSGVGDGHPLAAGDWYFLAANSGGGMSFASFKADLTPAGPARPASHPSTCSLDTSAPAAGIPPVGPTGGVGGCGTCIPACAGKACGDADGCGDTCHPGSGCVTGGAPDAGGGVTCGQGTHTEGGTCVPDRQAIRPSGCGCGAPGIPGALALAALLAVRRRRG